MFWRLDLATGLSRKFKPWANDLASLELLSCSEQLAWRFNFWHAWHVCFNLAAYSCEPPAKSSRESLLLCTHLNNSSHSFTHTTLTWFSPKDRVSNCYKTSKSDTIQPQSIFRKFVLSLCASPSSYLHLPFTLKVTQIPKNYYFHQNHLSISHTTYTSKGWFCVIVVCTHMMEIVMLVRASNHSSNTYIWVWLWSFPPFSSS